MCFSNRRNAAEHARSAAAASKTSREGRRKRGRDVLGRSPMQIYIGGGAAAADPDAYVDAQATQSLMEKLPTDELAMLQKSKFKDVNEVCELFSHNNFFRKLSLLTKSVDCLLFLVVNISLLRIVRNVFNELFRTIT